MKEYGANESGSSSWSNYKKNENDLHLDKGSAVEICKILGKGDFEKEEDARQFVLRGVSYSLDKCEIYDDTAIVTVEMELPDKLSAKGTFTFIYSTGDWKIDPSSVYSVIMAGNGIGGSGNHITDIFDALAS